MKPLDSLSHQYYAMGLMPVIELVSAKTIPIQEVYDADGMTLHRARTNIANSLKEETRSRYIFSLNPGHTAEVISGLDEKTITDIMVIVPIKYEDPDKPRCKITDSIAFINIDCLISKFSNSSDEDKYNLNSERNKILQVIGTELTLLSAPRQSEIYEINSLLEAADKRSIRKAQQIEFDIEEFEKMQLEAARELAFALSGGASNKLADTVDFARAFLEMCCPMPSLI